MSKNDPRLFRKLIHVWGGEGSEKPKNRSTWFVDDPLRFLQMPFRLVLTGKAKMF